MFLGAKLSVANYDALLSGWSAQVLQPDLVFYAPSEYCDEASRAILTGEPNSWYITDGGLHSNCEGSVGGDGIFTDLEGTDEYYEAVMELYEEGIVEGYSDGSIRVNGLMNRAELMKILIEGLEITPDADEYSACFVDVKEEWYAPYICYAKEAGWVQGYPDGYFHPEKTANQAEVLKMILESQGLAGALTELLDAEWYVAYVMIAEDLDLLDADSFTLDTLSTRGFAFWLLAEVL